MAIVASDSDLIACYLTGFIFGVRPLAVHKTEVGPITQLKLVEKPKNPPFRRINRAWPHRSLEVSTEDDAYEVPISHRCKRS